MDYDDNFQTLDEILNTINSAVRDLVKIDSADIAGPYFSYMFDKNDGGIEDRDAALDEWGGEDMEIETFTLSPLH